MRRKALHQFFSISLIFLLGMNLIGSRAIIGGDDAVSEVKVGFSDIDCSNLNEDFSNKADGANDYNQFKLSERVSLPVSSASLLDFSDLKTVDFLFEHFLLTDSEVFEFRLSHFEVVSIYLFKILFHHSLVMNAP